jgi:ubiquinone/menaquinone biosynthesis C-methylase UbiE
MTTAVGMSESQRTYLPAAGRDLFLPLYDLIAKVLGADRGLDIGCGTGIFATILKQRYPAVEVIGLDPDPKALARAMRKAEQAKVSVHFDKGFADSLECPAMSFDLVFSSFMFHHLVGSNREKTLREVRRVLKLGGSFYLLRDSQNARKSQFILFSLVLDGLDTTKRCRHVKTSIEGTPLCIRK